MMIINSGFLPVPIPLFAFPVACGNAGDVKLIAQDGTIRELGQLGASPSGWNDNELALSRGEELAPRVYGRKLFFRNIDTGVERDSGIDPAQNPGYWPQIACKNRKVVCSVPENHWAYQIQADGTLTDLNIGTEEGAGQIEDFDGKHILYPVFKDGQYIFVVRNIETATDVLRVPKKLENARIDLLSDGPWLSWNEGGKMHVMTPNGREWVGPDGEGRGLMFEPEQDAGVVYAVNATNEGWTPIWIIRKFSEWSSDGPAWTLRDVGFDGMQVVNGQAMGFVQNVGTLTIKPVPFGTPMTPYVKPVEPPVVVPPVVVPPELDPNESFDFPDALQPRWRGHLYSLDSWPGNVGGGERTFGAIIEALGFYNDGRPYVPIAHESRVIAPWCTPKETRDQEKHGRRSWADERAQILAFCQKYHVPVVMYADMPWWQLEADEQDFITNGVTVVRGLCAYPGSPDETGEDYSARITKGIDDAPGSVYIQRPTYTYLGTWVSKDKRLVRKFNKILTTVIERYPPSKVVGDMGFGMDRQPNDAWNFRYLTALCERTPEPIYSTLIPPAPIVVVPPAQPPVVVKPASRWPWGNADKPVIKKPGKRGTLG